jgi:uncharacterized protein YutE (UPF0331/DUF86 family)
MKSEVILSKLQFLNRCVNRISSKISDDFISNLDSQDIVTLNLQRAIQISIDIGAIILKESNIEIPINRSEIFSLLHENKKISSSLANSLKKSVGFRNLAVHEYSKLDLEKVYFLSKSELDIFLEFGKVIYTLYES